MVVYNYYYVSNKKRISGTDNNFIVDHFSFPYCRFFRLKRATFPNLIYNVDINNNTIDYRVNNVATLITATIPPGQYNSGTLLTAINTALSNVNGVAWTATYSALTGKITLTPASGTDVIRFDFTTNTSFGDVMGFNLTVNVVTEPSAVTGDYPINLSYPSAMYLCSKALTNYDSQISVSGDPVENVLAVIPIDQPFPYIVDTKISCNFSIFPKQNKVLDFQLKDQDNNLLPINGMELTLEFLLTDSVEGLWG